MSARFKIICLFLFLIRPLAVHADIPVIGEGQVKVDKKLLRMDVEFLSDSLCGGRAAGSPRSFEAAAYICRRLRETGYAVEIQAFRTNTGKVGHNIVAVPAAVASEGFPAWPLGFLGDASLTGNPSGGKSGTAKPLMLVMAYYDGLGVLDGTLYPGADSNASGVAALLALSERLKGRGDVMLAFVDGHNSGLSGSAALAERLRGRKLSMVVNLDILGGTLAPVDKYWKDYLIALGADRYSKTFEKCNEGLMLHLYYDYYRSRSFTDLFYRRIGDHKEFLSWGAPVIVFTSGITLNTNRPDDTASTLDYEVFSRRVEFIARFLERR